MIGALVLREMHGRYGRDNIGYLWMVVEPMILASVISLIHLAQPTTHYGSDIGVVPFTIVGYSIFIIFRGIFNRAEGSIEGNQSLLHHRSITIVDITVARSLLDVGGCFVTLVFLLFVAWGFGYAHPPARPHHLMIAMVLMTWWSLGTALVAIGLTYGSHSLARLMHPISYFCIPLSGAWFMLEWVPEGARQWLRWFPMVPIFEQARYGQFRSASPDYINMPYVIAVCAFLTYWGLLLCRRLRRRVAVR